MKHLRKRNHLPRKAEKSSPPADVSRPFVEHLYELRKRLLYIVVSVLVFSTLAYSVQQYLVNFLLRPSKNQQFIYTSPGGGISFLFTICTYTGIAASVPVIIYQILGFLEPLIADRTRRRIIKYSFFSTILAAVGFCFGYFVGLPIALHFLSSQFTNRQIHPLFTIQEYMSFLTIYLLGSVLLCQIPLFLMFTNHIRPLPPRKLMSAERYVIVGAFVVAMIMAPTTNIFDQLIIAAPIIFVYNVSVIMIWMTNRRLKRPDHIVQLINKDRQVQETRLSQPRRLLNLQTPADSKKSFVKLPAIDFAPKSKRVIQVR